MRSLLLFALWSVVVLQPWAIAPPTLLRAEQAGVSFPGSDGPGKGKKIVLVGGDEEYRSEEALPQLAKILSKRHGFDCTVLFAIDPKNGTVNPDERHNIPGLEALDQADLMIVFLRRRSLPDEQMKHIADFVAAGKPVIGLRTATHSFFENPSPTYRKFDDGDKASDGGFGRQVLGETWVAHHGHHRKQSTRGVIVPEQASHPVLRGIKDREIWTPTDVYAVRLPMLPECQPLLLGETIEGMKPEDKPAKGKQNNPMMPVAWTKTYKGENGHEGRVVTTTMGASIDLENAALRRLLVNACYWTLGLEDKLPADADVTIVGKFEPTMFGFEGFHKGLKPEDFCKD